MLERVREQEPAICAILMWSTKSEDQTMSLTDDKNKAYWRAYFCFGTL